MNKNTPIGLSTMTSAVAEAHNYNNWILRKFAPFIGKSLLEIGVGYGNYKPKVAHLIDNYIGVDIDDELLKTARRENPGDSYIQADVSSSDFMESLAGRQVDTVLMVNVLEHIPDHEAALNNLLSALKQNGHLLLFVPAFMCLYNDMDTLAGHHRRYTKRSLKSIIPPSGTKLVRLEYFNVIGGLGWWANKFTKHDDLDSKAINKQTLFFDRYLTPLSRLANPVSKHAFGQSLICVLQKQ